MPLCSRLLGSVNLLVMPSWSPFAAFEHLEGTTCNPVLHESHHHPFFLEHLDNKIFLEHLGASSFSRLST
jgi:hypothetical protein